MLRDLRLRALQADPDSFGSSYEREVDRPADAWERWALESSTGYQQCLFVAESDGHWVGIAGAYMPAEEPGSRELFGMWVAPAARAAGVGTELVQSVLDWSIRGGAEEIRLWVVESNRVAGRLYERAGFAETGVFQPLPSNPSLTETRMSLRLGSD
jgi:RimJ/RimL family protein N-acetyltransferase